MNPMGLYVVNPGDRDWTRHRYVLWFGAYGDTHLMVWANDLDSALEECGEWLAKHAPGHIMGHDSEELQDLIREAAEELGEDPEDPSDEAYVDATTDLTYTEAGFLTAYEWGITFEDPTRDQLRAFLAFSRSERWEVRS